MDPLVTTVNKAAMVIEAKRAVLEIFMSLSSWDHYLRPVEENVDTLEFNCTAHATNCKVARLARSIL